MATQPEVLQIEVAPVEVSTPRTRKMRVAVTPAMIEEIRGLAAQCSQKEISRRLGITAPAVSNIYKRENLPRRDNRGVNTPPELVEKVRALALQFPQTEVAKQVGMHRSWLSRIYKQFGIPALRFPKPPKPKPVKPVQKVCVIKITSAMRQSAHKRGIEIGAYFVQLFEADAAEDRLKAICANPKPEPEPEAVFKKSAPINRFKKIDGIVAQRILFLSSSEGLNAPEIAQRIGASVSTVRRILDTRKGSTVRTYGGQRRQREQWDALVFGAAQKTRGEATA